MTTTALVVALACLAVGLTVVGSSSAHSTRQSQRARIGKVDEPVQRNRPAIDLNATDPRIFDLPHGNHVDAYWSKGRHDVPWVVFVHGGFWSYGYAYSASTRAWGQHERARGFAAFSIDYRLVPHVQWPTPEDDVATAVRWIRAHARLFGLDINRGFIIGHSSGALMSSITALNTGDFIGAIDAAGAVDPLAEYESAPDPHLRTASLALMGDRLPIDDPSLWQSARVVNYIGRHKFPFLIMQSRHDRTVPFASSAQFAAALDAHDYQVELMRLPGTKHELLYPPDIRLQDRWMDQVLRATER